MAIEANTFQHLSASAQVFGFKENNPGINRGLDIQIWMFFHFFLKNYYQFSIFCAWRSSPTLCNIWLLQYWAGPLIDYLFLIKVLTTKFCSHIKKPVILISTNRLRYAFILKWRFYSLAPSNSSPLKEVGFFMFLFKLNSMDRFMLWILDKMFL